jgi:hypothetical protein
LFQSTPHFSREANLRHFELEGCAKILIRAAPGSNADWLTSANFSSCASGFAKGLVIRLKGSKKGKEGKKGKKLFFLPFLPEVFGTEVECNGEETCFAQSIVVPNF